MIKYLLPVLLLCGCAAPPYYAPSSGPTAPPSTAPSPPSPDSVPIAPAIRQPAPADSAVAGLLDQAKVLHRAGNYQRSLAVAERALRLDRHEPNVYLLLAANYVALEDYQQAQRLIHQGLPLARGEARLESHFRILLQEIGKRSQD